MSWGYVMRFVVAVIVGLGPFGAVGASMPPQEDQASLQASFLQWAFDAGLPTNDVHHLRIRPTRPSDNCDVLRSCHK